MESFWNAYEQKGKLLIAFSKAEAEQVKGRSFYTWARRAIIKDKIVIGYQTIYLSNGELEPQKPSQTVRGLGRPYTTDSAGMVMLIPLSPGAEAALDQITLLMKSLGIDGGKS